MTAICVMCGEALATDTVPVTVDNFVRAESDLYFGNVIKQFGFGKFGFQREPTPIDDQTVIRMNRDTLYGGTIFDLDAGPVRITLPDPGKRFMSMQIVDEDEYTPAVFYGAGSHTLTKEQIDTRYVLAAARVLADPNDPEDLKQAQALQDAIKAEQPGGPGKFEVPDWDPVSQKTGNTQPRKCAVQPETELVRESRRGIRFRIARGSDHRSH